MGTLAGWAYRKPITINHMPDETIAAFCGLAASESAAPYDDYAWQTPTAVYLDDAAYAYITNSAFDSGKISYVLKCTTLVLVSRQVRLSTALRYP